MVPWKGALMPEPWLSFFPKYRGDTTHLVVGGNMRLPARWIYPRSSSHVGGYEQRRASVVDAGRLLDHVDSESLSADQCAGFVELWAPVAGQSRDVTSLENSST